MFKVSEFLLYDIQKYTIHDGPGIRTLVFLKGCPLNCLWCCNPESQNLSCEIFFNTNRCIACKRCATECPISAIHPTNFQIDRELCNGCRICGKVCPVGAKKTIGEYRTIDNLLEIVDRDRIFYRNSGGGVTVGGGEPLLQHNNLQLFLRECKSINIHTAIETSGYAEWDHLKDVLQYTDLVYFDLKHIEPKQHKILTGVDNKMIIDNALKVSQTGIQTIFRIPVIPGYNDDQINLSQIASIAENSECRIELLPYHSYGEYKYPWLGRKYKLTDLPAPSKILLQKLKQYISSFGCDVTIIR